MKWRCQKPHGIDCFVILFGGFHVEMAASKALVNLLDVSGWTSALVQADFATPGTPGSPLKADQATPAKTVHMVPQKADTKYANGLDDGRSRILEDGQNNNPPARCCPEQTPTQTSQYILAKYHLEHTGAHLNNYKTYFPSSENVQVDVWQWHPYSGLRLFGHLMASGKEGDPMRPGKEQWKEMWRNRGGHGDSSRVFQQTNHGGSFRLLAAHDISKILYANKCQALTIFHAFTGCLALAAGVRKLRGRHDIRVCASQQQFESYSKPNDGRWMSWSLIYFRCTSV